MTSFMFIFMLLLLLSLLLLLLLLLLLFELTELMMLTTAFNKAITKDKKAN